MARSTRGATRRRWIFWAGLGVIAAGVWVIAPHEPGTQGRGVRRALWIPFFGVPDGGLGRAGIRLLAKRHAAFAAMAKELDLQPDDDLLDIGCGPGGLLAEQAGHVRFVAGLGLGAEIPLAYAYAAEFAPRRNRGRVMAIVNMVGGCLPFPLAILFALAFRAVLGWQGIFVVIGLAALVVFVFRISLPESPRWLALHGRVAEADAVLSAIERDVVAAGPLPAGCIHLPDHRALRFIPLMMRTAPPTRPFA